TGLHEPTVELFRLGLREAVQPRGQPAVAAVGQDGQRHVQIHVEADLTGQAVQVKEVDADPQGVLDAVPPRVAGDHVAAADLEVVGQAQRRLLPAQAAHRQLTERARVAAHADGFLHVADVLVATLGDVHDGPAPGRGRQGPQAAEDGGPAPANG